MKEYKDKQYELNQKLQEHTKADESYHITASTVFSLANRALEVFESSEPQEKRQLLDFLLQNCQLNGKKLEFSMRSPFNVILETAHQPIGLPLQDKFRTLNWRKIKRDVEKSKIFQFSQTYYFRTKFDTMMELV